MQINNQLTQDCYEILRLKNIQVLLHKNALVPWFILVPLSDSIEYRELFEIPKMQRSDLEEFSDVLSHYLIENFQSEKINVAAIGNLVSQLHIHVVGRKQDDACWPNPVWGNLNEHLDYLPQDVKKIQADIAQLVSP